MVKLQEMTRAQKLYGAAALVVGGTLLLPDLANAGRSLLPSQMAKDIVKAYGISEDLALAIAEVASDLDVDAYALANVINFESGFNAQAVNPSSGASGLIQFMPRTATGLGTSVGAIRGMSALQQMVLVRRYFEPFEALRRPHSVAMAVFYPKAINWLGFRPFPFKVIKANGWKILTPAGYLRMMNERAKLPSVVPR